VSWRQSFFACVGAIAVAFGFAAPLMAQSTTDTVTVTLGGGIISFSIDVTANISSLSYNHETGYTNGSGGAFTVDVKDDRNTSAGYVISLAASTFTRTGGNGSIVLGSTGTLSVPTAGTVTRVSGDPVNLPMANTAASLSGTAVPILTALQNTGNGHYTAAGYALALSGVSASVPNGTYTSTLTVSSNAGPQS
jgi:hypothetical protein